MGTLIVLGTGLTKTMAILTMNAMRAGSLASREQRQMTHALFHLETSPYITKMHGHLPTLHVPRTRDVLTISMDVAKVFGNSVFWDWIMKGDLEQRLHLRVLVPGPSSTMLVWRT